MYYFSDVKPAPSIKRRLNRLCNDVRVNLNPRLNHYYYRLELRDQRIATTIQKKRLQGCLGELATLENCCNVVVMHTQPPQSFGLLGQAAK